jgi:DNA-directed RNA polymerase beta subunit
MTSSTPGPNDTYYCSKCQLSGSETTPGNYTEIYRVVMPYACKLMIQELLGMCVAPRIRVQKRIAANL